MRKLFVLLSLFSIIDTTAQSSYTSAEIYQGLKKLDVLGSVLYVAAHPDDENTRLLAYFAKDKLYRTGYLSLTRGDGGQNLIGDEQGIDLGLIRTQELLAARKIDGAEQFFTRAFDFGYSKTAEESLEFWGKDEVLGDIVYIIRHYKPHIIINRFPASGYSGHGHHSASALLSSEAFDLAGDEASYPEQLIQAKTWSPGTLYQNSSTWWDKSLADRAANDYSLTVLDAGADNNMLGYSCNEIAALSRSQHKSQGFGAETVRGEQKEYLEYLKGSFRPDSLLNPGLLDSTDQLWLGLSPHFDSILNDFDFRNPSKMAGRLMDLLAMINKADSSGGRFDKKAEKLIDIIAACLGLSAEVISTTEKVQSGGRINARIIAVNRSGQNIYLDEIDFQNNSFSWNRELEHNLPFEDTITLEVSANTPLTNPYWLENAGDFSYNHDRILLKNPGYEGLSCKVKFTVEGRPLVLALPVKFKWTDRVKGGCERGLQVVPDVVLSFDQEVYFPKDSAIKGNVIVRSLVSDTIRGKLLIGELKGLSVKSGDTISLLPGQSQAVPFTAVVNSPPDNLNLTAVFAGKKDSSRFSLRKVEYEHITAQNVLTPAVSKILPVEQGSAGPRIAYAEGPDSELYECLKRSGCNITPFTTTDLVEGKLPAYNVLLFGIRSINVNPAWDTYARQIQDFIKKGGLVVVLYQTSRDLKSLKMAPYPFEISSLRITEENSGTSIIRPEHPILNQPFRIERNDFNGWKQERGLYFADKWDTKYTTLLSWHDNEELDLFGSIIVGDYGKGGFIYTGISFFRHIPDGNPGSYKLLINILNYKKS